MAATPLRRAVALRLRRVADRLDARRHSLPVPRLPVAPLVRMNGRWWRREELGGGLTQEEGTDVQLLP